MIKKFIFICILIFPHLAHAKICGSSQNGFYFFELVQASKLNVVTCKFEQIKSGKQRAIVGFSNGLTVGLIETGNKSELMMMQYRPSGEIMYKGSVYQVVGGKDIPLIEFKYRLSYPIKFSTLSAKDYSTPIRQIKINFNDGNSKHTNIIRLRYRIRLESF